jgi:hypothetical protein
MADRKPHVANRREESLFKTKMSWTLVLAISLFILTRVFILFVLDPILSDARDTYFVSAIKAYDGQLIPYQYDLPIVYPPVAWWTTYAPRFFDSRRLLDPQDHVQAQAMRVTYCRLFRTEMCLCDVASFILLLMIVNQRRAGLAGWAGITYTAITAILAHLLYDRLDVGLACLLLAWAFCWIQSFEEQAPSISWSAAAYAFIGLGISYKIIPIIVIPFLILADWKSPRRALRLSLCMFALLATAGLPFLIQYSISGFWVFDFLRFHSQRGIQIESLYATLMMIGSLLGADVFTKVVFGGINLSGDLSKLMINISTIALLVFLGCAWLWLLFRPAISRRQEGYRLTCFVLIAAVILSKVLSPQYFIWGLPMSLLLAVEIFPQSRVKLWTLTVVWLFIAVLSTWLFPYHYLSTPGYPGLASLNPLEAKVFNSLPWLVLGLRNFLYLGLVTWLGVILFRHPVHRPSLTAERQNNS